MLVEDVDRMLWMECAELIFTERLHYDEERENWILNRYQAEKGFKGTVQRDGSVDRSILKEEARRFVKKIRLSPIL
jgi:hypothetical protein